MIGDCSRPGCGHSIAYHVPIVGCMKCDCDEYKVFQGIAVALFGWLP